MRQEVDPESRHKDPPKQPKRYIYITVLCVAIPILWVTILAIVQPTQSDLLSLCATQCIHELGNGTVSGPLNLSDIPNQLVV